MFATRTTVRKYVFTGIAYVEILFSIEVSQRLDFYDII